MNNETKQLFHPLVEGFVGIDPIPQNMLALFKSHSQDAEGDPARALQALLEACSGKGSSEKALELARVALLKAPDPGVYLLIVMMWTRLLLHREDRWQELKTLINLARSSISAATPAELVAWHNFCLLYVATAEGRMVDYSRIIKDILDNVKPTSPHYLRLTQSCDMAYHQLGMGADLSVVEDYNELNPEDPYEGRLLLLRFINAVQTGQWSLAENALQKAGRFSPEVRSASRDDYAVALLTLTTATSISHKTRKCVAYDLQTFGEPDWLKSTQALLANQPGEALRLARADASTGMWSRRTRIGFDAYVLLRAEISSRNVAAAIRILDQRRKVGTQHYLDAFFRMRIELLEGDKEAAVYHYQQLMNSIARYSARGRLDLEIRLSTELSSTALLEVAQKANERFQLGSYDRGKSAPENIPESLIEAHRRSSVTEIKYTSPGMRAVMSRVKTIAVHDVPVLLTGETGTGKELLARAIHDHSPRRNEPFIAVNCGAVAETLIESELFGHTRGAFSGAQNNHPGVFVGAGKGTIFLDEIGDISPKLQITLLRVLESGEVRAVGSNVVKKINCRIIAATNADLNRRVMEGAFRRDLLHRLDRLRVFVPPLRERPEDIMYLANYFINQGRPTGQRATLSEDLSLALSVHPWPGNVRELKNVIERMRVLNSDKLRYAVEDLELNKVEEEPQAQGVTNESHAVKEYAFPDVKKLTRSIGTIGNLRNEKSLERDTNLSLLRRRSRLRQLQRLRELFESYRELQVADVAEALEICRTTASRYLGCLCDEKRIEKVEPNRSRNSHYYRSIQSAAGRHEPISG